MKKRMWLAALLLTGLGASMAVQMNRETPLELETSIAFPEAKALTQFQLRDQHGQTFSNADLLGKWSLVFLGYTSCPDVCPTTMSKLMAAYPSLRREGPFQVVFLSVDPARDTEQKLLDYMNFFNPEFIAVTGEHSQLLPLSRSLSMVYAMVGEGEDYRVDHSASMVLISPKGEKVAVIKPQAVPGQLPQISNRALIADVGRLIHSYSG
jgi:protein SCO1